MVKLINHRMKPKKTRHNASLQVMQLAHNFESKVSFTEVIGILYDIFLGLKINFDFPRNCFYQCNYQLYDCSLYKTITKLVVVVSEKSKTESSKSQKKSRSFIHKGESGRGYKSYTEPKPQNNSEDIKAWFKLYRSILAKFRYSSLKLTVQCGALLFMAQQEANFPISNPVRVGSTKNNKEQCHRLWQCENIVDS